MNEQVEMLIEELIPEIREQIENELRPLYDQQYKEQLSAARREISDADYRQKQIEDIRNDLSKQIIWQLEQEFEEEKQSLIHNVSQGLNKSKAVQQLEKQLRQKIENENVNYIEEETKRKLNLVRINAQRQFENDKELMTQDLTDEFAQKLSDNLQALEQNKQQILQELQLEKDKLGQIETEKRQFKQSKVNQEDKYSKQIEALHQQIQTLTHQINTVKIVSPKAQDNAKLIPSIDLQHQQSPFGSALKHQVLEEIVEYDGIDIIDYDQLPDIFHIDNSQSQSKQPPTQSKNQQQSNQQHVAFNEQRATLQTHDSQIVSFNVSQPSILKTNQQSMVYPQRSIQSIADEARCQQSQAQSVKQLKDSKMTQVSQNQSMIIERLEQMCRDKLKENDNQSHNIQQQPKVEKTQLDEFEQLFQPDHKDSAQTKALKLLRANLQLKFQEDLHQEEFYFQQITYLKFNFVNSFPKNLQESVQQQVASLLDICSKGHLSYSERIQLIQQIVNASHSLNELIRINEECIKHYQQYQQLIEKLQQRQSFRTQIQKENFSVQRNKKVFQTLRTLSLEIKDLLKCKFCWREVDVEQILTIDQLEQQLVEREEMKEDIRRRVGKKFKH